MIFPDSQVSAVVLGIAQDAGLPHVGCRCPRCVAAYQNPGRGECAACLALVDNRQQPPAVWLVDATPDIKHQINLLANALGPHPTQAGRLRQPDGLFLTHAHMGHTAGLAQLGPEGMNVQRLPLYASAGLLAALRATRLWQPLVAHLELIPLEAGQPLQLAPELTITPISVPHRDEIGAGTFAFRIRGPSRSLLYLPDIDGWQLWPAAKATLAASDVALVDASFFSDDELGGRRPVAHPLVPETLAFCSGLPTQLVLTHLNHTNPLLDEDSQERGLVEEAGAMLAHTGLTFAL